MALNPGDHPHRLDRRRWSYHDQHGRKWTAQVSRATGHPVEPLNPQGWKEPVRGGRPEMGFIRFPRTEDDDQNSIVIDYEQLVGRAESAEAQWFDDVVKFGQAKYGDQFDAQKIPNDIIRLVGPRPFPSKFWIACREGDQWALGLAAKQDPWARDLFPPPPSKTDFLKRGKPQLATAGAGG